MLAWDLSSFLDISTSTHSVFLSSLVRAIFKTSSANSIEFADEVLKIALTKELKKTEWVEVDMSKKDDKSQASIQ